MNGTSLLAQACAAALFCTGAASAENASGLIDSSKLNDKKVTDLQGQELGEIERLLVDPQTGQVQYAVVDVGTFLKQQGTEVAVPWQSLKVNREGTADDFKVQLDATKEKLQSAPRFSEAEADRLFTPSGGQVVQKYWTVTVTETRSPQQPQEQNQPQQQGLPGSQPTGPTVESPSDESGKSSATEQNNSPAGRESETSPGTVTTPDSSSLNSPSSEPAPSTTPPTSSTSPTDTSEAKPAGPSANETDTSTSIPSEPSTTP